MVLLENENIAMKKLLIVAALFALIFGGIFAYRARSNSPHSSSSNIEALPANPEGIPKWGKASFYGEFILVEQGPDKKAKVMVLFARKAKKGWMPKDLIEGLDVQSLEESSGDKMLIGELYKDVNELGFFTLKTLPTSQLKGRVYEFAVSDGDRLFRVKRSDDNPIFNKSVAVFKKAFAKSQQGR